MADGFSENAWYSRPLAGGLTAERRLLAVGRRGELCVRLHLRLAERLARRRLGRYGSSSRADNAEESPSGQTSCLDDRRAPVTLHKVSSSWELGRRYHQLTAGAEPRSPLRQLLHHERHHFTRAGLAQECRCD